MKEQPLTITEYHPPHTDPPNQVIRQAITAWLTKELRSGDHPVKDYIEGI